MPPGRNHSATYQARNVLARSQGFSSYYEKRKALEYARSGHLAGMFRDTTLIESINARNPDHLRLVRDFYYGWRLNPDDYTLTGDKYAFMEKASRLNRDGMVENLSAHARWLWEKGNVS